MVQVNIHSIKLGVGRCYVIQGERTILIDAGGPRQAAHFRQAMKALAIDLHSVRLIVITHGHWDHIGSARDIQDMTGARIAMHHRERDWLEESMKVLSPAATLWGHVVRAMMVPLLPLIHFPATNVTVVVGNEGASLLEYGIPGRVLYTPGHSAGSVSVLLDTGEAFVGDLAMNEFPLRLRPGLPIFAEDMEKVRDSWRRLLAEGAKTVYPAHGKPFAAEIIRKSLAPER